MESDEKVQPISMPPPPPPPTPPQKAMVVMAIVVMIVIVMLALPIIPVQETYMEPYQESYQDTEPYNRIATYTITRSEMIGGWSLFEGCYLDVYVKIRNTDVEGGTFRVSIRIEDITSTVYSNSKSNYIGPGDEYQFHWHYDSDCGTNYVWSKSVVSPTIIDERVVTKTRTSYREATRTVNKSIIQILLGG